MTTNKSEITSPQLLSWRTVMGRKTSNKVAGSKVLIDTPREQLKRILSKENEGKQKLKFIEYYWTIQD